MNENTTTGTLADVLGLIDQAALTGTRQRDMVSAINRICEMAGTTPVRVRVEPAVLKDVLSRIRPAAHGVSAKSYSNLRSLFAAALQLAGAVDPSGRGSAKRHQAWGSLLEGITVPVLVTHGRSDTVVLPAMADYILNHCKTAEVSWYEGVGHAPFLEEPLRFNTELKRFAVSAHH